ncbi:CpaF family protein [Bacillus infantis]|uniref:CpaF family protein n=1 Tax=Bacillus infantis TaxID=324767 RepID=A0A5D4QPF6_9BACI|nr:CpaF family protein [Bacillus infantis]
MSLFEKKTEKKASRSSSRTLLENHYISELVDHYKTRILKEANLEVLTNLPQGEMRLRIEQLISQYMSEEKIILPRHDKELLLTRIIDESIGYGPLEPLLNDATITEILINGPKEIYIEKLGKLQPAPISFRDDSHVRHVIDRIVAPLGRRIDDSSPMVDARLPDGSRVNAVIPPISLNGPLVSIRKFRKDPFKMSDLLKFETLNDDMSVFLDAIVKSKLNVLISGGTGSGKTTLLNVLGKSIPAKERVITIEDSAELRLDKPNVVGMEARPENMEGEGEITIRHLVKNSLRMRPDRIIVGEVRGAEAFDMLQAMNTGHEGSITTVHANTPFDALRRVEGMVIMAGMDLPSSIIREYIVGALDIIVQSSRLTDGTRKITSICEIYRNENGEITINEIFSFKRNGLKGNGQVDGYFTPTGHLPKCLERIKIFGIDIPDTLFTA